MGNWASREARAQRREVQPRGLGQTVAHARQGPGDAVPDQERDAEIRGGMLSRGSSHLLLAPPGQA